MKKPFRLLWLALNSALATTTAASEPAPAPAEATETAGFHLQNRSAFTSPETSRPPFWPVGWVKQTVAGASMPVAMATQSKIEPDQFSVTSILLGRPSLAVINGKAYGEGEFLRSPRVKATDKAAAIPASLRIRVLRITDGTVTLEAANHAITVPLRRPQLLEHKSDDELLPVSER